MHFERSSGVLLHLTSLASHGGIGDLGPAAHDFVSFLASAKQHVWQVLPVCPTGYGNSPYAGSSAFAGNPYFISLEVLADWGWISRESIASLSGPSGHVDPGSAGHVDFAQVEQHKLPLLHEAAANFLQRAQHEAKLQPQWEQFRDFCHEQSAWLADYALYAVLRREFNTGAWTAWPEPLRKRPAGPRRSQRTSRQSRRPGKGFAVCLLTSVGTPPKGRCMQCHSHPWRRSHLRQHGLG
jgi:4-alpha-glucanotransferase